MSVINRAVKGSGYYDLFLDDNSVVRVQDNQTPTNYVPTNGDEVSLSEDGVPTFKGTESGDAE